MADTVTPTPQRKASLAQSELAKYHKAFNAVDTDRDGFVSLAELKDVAYRVGYRLDGSQIEGMLSEELKDGCSKFSLQHFIEKVVHDSSVLSPEDHKLAGVREKFQRYDTDQNGQISLNEAQWALMMELDVTGSTALRLLNQFVQLNYDQFAQFYTRIQHKKLEMYEKFGKYDLDKDGMISVEEAHKILQKELGYSMEKSRAMVTRFDANKDGKVSYIEFAEFYIAVEEKKDRIRQTFKKYDPEDQGYVTLEQAKQILEGLLGFSAKKCSQTIDMYDKNKDGKIDYKEFLEFYSMLEEERNKLMTEFSRFDSDQDGRISCEEFRSMLQERGYTTSEADKLMEGYDLDHDGYLNFEEFKRFLNFS